MYPPSPKERAAAAAGQRSGRAGGGFFATMVQDARAANDETLAGDEDDHVFYKLPVWKRVVIMLGGPVMNLLFAIVLFSILLSGIGVQTAHHHRLQRQRVHHPRRRRPHRVRGIRPRRPRRGGGAAARATSSSPVDGQPISTFAEASALIRAVAR